MALGLFVLALAGIFALPAPSRGQSSNGTLVGAVTDPTGAGIPGATINVISAQYGIPRKTITDSVGTYRIEGLQPGTYSVTFMASGFATLTVSGTNVQGSVTTTANGLLKLGIASATITVEAGAEQSIDTQSGAIGKSMGAAEIENLPYSSFNPAELALTLPGVQDVPAGQGAVNAAQFIEGLAFSVNGTRPHGNNFLIDGQDDNDTALSGQAYVPDNLGLISEISVLQSSYSAQYGFGGGSVTNYITENGTNGYHGSLWEVNQSSALASENAAAKFIGVSKKPFLVENTFGLELGGPVRRDKLFFYGTAQWNPTRQRETTDSGAFVAIPDANGVATLTALAQTNVEAKYFLDSLDGLVSPSRSASIPCGSGTYDENAQGTLPCIEMNLFARNNVPVAVTDDNWYFRMDYHPTENDQITAGFLHAYSDTTPNLSSAVNTLRPFDSYASGPSSIFRSHWARTFSPSLLNEVRFSYTSLDFSFGFLPASLANPLSSLPFLVFNDSRLPNIGLNSEFPQGRGHKTYEFQEMLVKSLGSHTLTAGVDFDKLDAHEVIPLATRGQIDYFPGGGFDAFGNFLSDFTGSGGTISRIFGNPVLNPNMNLSAPYIQDTWRVKSDLTLSLGLRYEYWGTPVNILKYPSISPALGIDPSGNFRIGSAPLSSYPNIYAAKEQPDRNNFAPRIGFAYALRGGGRFLGNYATVFRGGYGVFYDGLYTAVTDNSAELPPNALGGNIKGGSGQGQGQALEHVATITPTQDPSANSFTVASNLRNPTTQQWNLDVQRALPGQFVVTVSYVGTRGTKLFGNQDWNPETTGLPSSRINPNFGEISVRDNVGQSWYNSGQVEFEHNAGRGLMLRAAYTYSKFLDDTSEVFTTTGVTSYSQILTCQKCDWGPSTFDRRHRLVLSYVWAMPHANGNWLERALTDRWQWASIATFETGTPNNVGDGFDNIGNGHPGSRPNLNNPRQPITHIGFDGGDGNFYSITTSCLTIGACPVEPESYFRFIIPVSGPGNLGRNAVFGPGQVYFNTSLQRDFPFHIGRWEDQNLMFRAEFFNAFNHPNLFTPDYTMNSTDYGQVGATISGERDIKFWLKYSF